MNLNEVDVPPDQVPLLSDFLDPDDQQKAIDKTNRLIQDKFPQADFSRIGPIGFGKKPKIEAKSLPLARAKPASMGKLGF